MFIPKKLLTCFMASFCILLSQQVTATAIFFYYNLNKYNDQVITLKLQSSPNSVYGNKSLKYLPDWQEVQSVRIVPALKFPYMLETFAAIDGTDFRIAVDAKYPIQILGKKGEIFFDGQNGILDVKIPMAAIWLADINDK